MFRKAPQPTVWPAVLVFGGVQYSNVAVQRLLQPC